MSPAERLCDTLRQLHDCARHGRFQDFGPLAERLAQDLDGLERDGDVEERLQQVAQLSAEVAQILQAVESGFAAARQRLAEIRAVRNGQGTYGEDGRRRALAVPGRESRRV